MDISKQLMLENYRRLGFPAEISTLDRKLYGVEEKNMIISWPGWGAGFFVIDVDAHRSGLKAMKRLKKRGLLPKTVTAKTQSGGFHYYYKYPDGVEISSQVDWLPGIDILSEDARITMPPSVGGKTGKRYEWIHSPMSTPMVFPAPELLKAITQKQVEA